MTSLLVASEVPQSSPLFAQADAPIGIVDDPCPPPVPPLPGMEAFLEAMLDPRTPDAGTPPPGGPAAEALTRSQAEQKARDWANLCRYRSESAALEPGEAKVVFMGDSITEARPRVRPSPLRPSSALRGVRARCGTAAAG